MTDHEHIHDWTVLPDTRNLKHGLTMSVCSCGEVGWHLPVDLSSPEQIEAYLDGDQP